MFKLLNNNCLLRKLGFILNLLLAFAFVVQAQKAGGYNAVYSGVPWFDEGGKVVSAHGGCIVKDNGRYYFFGEMHTDSSNVFAGFTCYSSADLYNWKFERMALPPQDTGGMGTTRVGERVKVMQCPKTGEYVMYMHSDAANYKDPYVAYATAQNITGPYSLKGPLLFNGKPVKKWDMGTFKDNDGTGYVIIHGGDIYKLSTDYKSVIDVVIKGFAPGSESPAVFRKGNMYYWLGSHLSSWERNDNFYYTATSLKGPWTYQGYFAPQGTLTWNSQTTFVLPVAGLKDTAYIFMGDRWSFPHQASSATYVWQPISVSGTSVAIPHYQDAWQIDAATGLVSVPKVKYKEIDHADKKQVSYSGKWQHSTATDTATMSSANARGAGCSVKFSGRRVVVQGYLRPNGGYAQITIYNHLGIIIYAALVDMYCKYTIRSTVFTSPVLPKDTYTLKVTATGEHGKWSDKKRNDYGSTGNFVSVSKFLVEE